MTGSQPADPTTPRGEAPGPSAAPHGVPAAESGLRPDGASWRDPLALVLVSLALVLGLGRFVELGAWSLWIDEVFTWHDARHGATGNYNGLGYWLVLWTVEALGRGPTEFALRFAPALAGWLTIPTIAWAFGPIAGARRAALAAFVVAASPWALYWSQNARFYTFVQLATVVGAGVLLRGLLRGRLAVVALGVVLTVGAALFQLQAVLVAGVLATGLVFVAPSTPEARRLARRAGWVALGVALVAAPWAWGVFDEFRDRKGGSIGAALHGLLTLGSAITPTLGAAFVLGAASALSERRGWGRFCAWCGVLGPAAIVGLGVLAKVSAQYAFAFLPWIAVVAAWPVGRGRALERAPLAAGWTVVLVAPLAMASALQLGPRQGDRPRWREAVEFVEARRAPGDLVVGLPVPVVEFYLGRGETDVRVTERALKLDWTVARSYEPYARAGRPMWFILRTDSFHDFWPEDRARLEGFLRDRCRRMAEFEVEIDARNLDVEVWYFE